MARTLTIITAALAALALAAPALTAGSASLVIHHQKRGCHSWSLNGGPFKAAQTVKLSVGSVVTVIDNDVMAHKLIKTSGPAVTMTKTGSVMHDMSNEFKGSGVMAHMGAGIVIHFTHAGTYTFITKAGEDYMKGITTTGEDNVLKLTVTVS